MKKIVCLLLFAASIVIMEGCNTETLSKHVTGVQALTKCCTQMLSRPCLNSSTSTDQESATASQEIVPAFLWDNKMMF